MLSEEQKNEVAKWFAAGEGVAEIQKRISAEFNIDMTYLDVRLLVADLPQPAEPEEVKSEEPVPEVAAEEGPAGDGGFGEPGEEYPDAAVPEPPQGDAGGQPGGAGGQPGEQPQGELTVSVDPLAPPGAIACGSVVFSDGTAGKWMLDQMGRLGLSGLPQGYRPSPEDGAQFQPKLVTALRAKGLA